ncbi:MAG TPA: hypothetical protein VEF76_05950 [Patescibacteria group bacterium]|nr:hypothetical protein [Patescibacteria group bacterium]
MPKSMQGMQMPKVPVGWKAPQQPPQSIPEKIVEQETEKNPK